MTTMVSEVYDALLSAGADDAKARRAAEVLTDFDDSFDRVERQIQGLERRINGVDAKIDLVRTELGGRMTLIQWQFGVLIAGTTAIILKLFI